MFNDLNTQNSQNSQNKNKHKSKFTDTICFKTYLKKKNFDHLDTPGTKPFKVNNFFEKLSKKLNSFLSIYASYYKVSLTFNEKIIIQDIINKGYCVIEINNFSIEVKKDQIRENIIDLIYFLLKSEEGFINELRSWVNGLMV